MKYTETHEWVQLDGETATIGISHYAQKELGDIVYVELPREGTELSSGEEAAVLESTKAAADVYTPLSGKVIEVNPRLSTEPELINRSPEKEGWICKLRISHPQEIDQLIDEETYKKQYD